jgi:hypothetical protein
MSDDLGPLRIYLRKNKEVNKFYFLYLFHVGWYKLLLILLIYEKEKE